MGLLRYWSGNVCPCVARPFRAQAPAPDGLYDGPRRRGATCPGRIAAKHRPGIFSESYLHEMLSRLEGKTRALGGALFGSIGKPTVVDKCPLLPTLRTQVGHLARSEL